MKKTEDGKTYIQIDDVLFMSTYDEEGLSKELEDKAFFSHRPLFIETMKEYIEVEGQEDIDFVFSKDYIYSKNDLDELSNGELVQKLNLLKEEMKLKFGLAPDPSDKEVYFYKHQLETLNYYLNLRIGQACETCENVLCSKYGKSNLDRTGEPIGKKCRRYINVYTKESNQL